jgi:primosomal protein N'
MEKRLKCPWCGHERCPDCRTDAWPELRDGCCQCRAKTIKILEGKKSRSSRFDFQRHPLVPEEGLEPARG